MEDRRKQRTVIVVKSKERGTRTKVTTCAYSYDGNLIGGGEFSEFCSDRNFSLTGYHLRGPFLLLACLDGAIHMWQANSNLVRPNMSIEGAHAKGVETGSIVFSVDGRTVLTRGGDDTVKRT